MRSTWQITAAGLGLAGALLAGCSSSSSAPQESASPSEATSATTGGDPSVRASAQKLIADGTVPGAVVLIQSDSERQEIAVGESDLPSGAPMSASLPFRIASVSKAFNGAVVLGMVNEGKLKLTDRLPAVWSQAPKAWRKVTVGQLLQHTSGLPDYIRSPKFVKDFIADPQMSRTPEQLVDYVRDEPTEFPPGKKYQYSDTDNIVAGLIAEQTSGKAYPELLGAVTTPLQLTQTTLPETSEMPAPFMHGYAPAEESGGEPEDVSELINPQLAWASGGMISTVDELNTFIRAYAAGDLVDDQVRAAQRQFVPGAGGPPGPGINSSGLAIYRYQTPCGTFLGHTGNMPGYTTFIGASLDGKDSVVVAINSQVSPTSAPDEFRALRALENVALCRAVERTG